MTTCLFLMLLFPDARPALAQDQDTQRAYRRSIERVTQMVYDDAVIRRAERLGLHVLNVLWEDTGRSAGSAYGPNISDVTLTIHNPPSRSLDTLLPVIRFPNFSDRTGDIPLDEFYVRVGNHIEGGKLQTVPLRDVLQDLNQYLSNPVPSDGPLNLLADRDTHLLVSAQHVFLPVPRQGVAEFVPTIFNYQSAPGNSAVLTLVVTREGMSATAIENYHQHLYYNAAGQRAPYTAERLSDVAERIESGQARESDQGALDQGSDVLLFIQVPLVHRNRGRLLGLASPAIIPDSSPASGASSGIRTRASDVERAVLGHGDTDGPHNELNGHLVRRDNRFPIRVTVQFYRATTNGVVSREDMLQVHSQISQVYRQADYVGSLVVPEGERHRPTDWILTNPGGDTWLPLIATKPPKPTS